MNAVMVRLTEIRDVVSARAKGRELAKRAGMGVADQTRLTTAISEIARNAIQHAGSGECVLSDESNEARMRISVQVIDHGPGIADVELAMRDGYSTGNSLGAGLPGARRITHEFTVESRPGFTRVQFCIQKPRTERSLIAR
jgi:serine/threonine-protein kinase RsbT